MTLKIKRIHKTETLDHIPARLPLYLTDEFRVWHYAVLGTETVLVVSSNSCQVQTFDETFNSKYSVTFDELTECTAVEFDEVYGQFRNYLIQADQQYQTHLQPDNVRILAGFVSEPDRQIIAHAS